MKRIILTIIITILSVSTYAQFVLYEPTPTEPSFNSYFESEKSSNPKIYFFKYVGTEGFNGIEYKECFTSILINPDKGTITIDSERPQKFIGTYTITNVKQTPTGLKVCLDYFYTMFFNVKKNRIAIYKDQKYYLR